MKKIILSLNIITLLISCDANNTANCHKIITVVNKTNKTIYIDKSGDYPETDFTKLIGEPKFSYNKVGANVLTNAALPSFGSCYENIYKNSVPSGIMMVYVFDGPTLETQGWDSEGIRDFFQNQTIHDRFSNSPHFKWLAGRKGKLYFQFGD